MAVFPKFYVNIFKDLTWPSAVHIGYVDFLGEDGIPMCTSLFCQAKRPVESFLTGVVPLKEQYSIATKYRQVSNFFMILVKLMSGLDHK
jgi:hypothetical protein